jgi:HSP20 family molecular chaperone IbpA
VDVRRSFEHLLGDTDATEDRAATEPSQNGSVVPTPTVVREDDGTIVFTMVAPDLDADSIRVEHESEGQFVIKADAAPTVVNHQHTETHFSINLNLPPEVDGPAETRYEKGVLEIRIPPS